MVCPDPGAAGGLVRTLRWAYSRIPVQAAAGTSCLTTCCQRSLIFYTALSKRSKDTNEQCKGPKDLHACTLSAIRSGQESCHTVPVVLHSPHTAFIGLVYFHHSLLPYSSTTHRHFCRSRPRYPVQTPLMDTVAQPSADGKTVPAGVLIRHNHIGINLVPLIARTPAPPTSIRIPLALSPLALAKPLLLLALLLLLLLRLRWRRRRRRSGRVPRVRVGGQQHGWDVGVAARPQGHVLLQRRGGQVDDAVHLRARGKDKVSIGEEGRGGEVGARGHGYCCKFVD